MRTKTLLLTAALSAAGIASSLGQVYSVNSVGYVNVALGTGFSIIANPLSNGDNRLSEIIPTAPNLTTVYKFDPATQSYLGAATYIQAQMRWSVDHQLPPGEGFFIRVLSPTTLTFVGEVSQGPASNVPLNTGFAIMGSAVPQAGLLSAELEYPASNLDTVYLFDNSTQTYEGARTYIASQSRWNPTEPNINVAQGFFLRRLTAGDWNRNFSVN